MESDEALERLLVVQDMRAAIHPECQEECVVPIAIKPDSMATVQATRRWLARQGCRGLESAA